MKRNTRLGEIIAELFDLCRLARAIDSRKRDQYRFQRVIPRTRSSANTPVQCPGLFGTCPGLAAVRAATVPRAAPAPARNPNLISQERICRCLGGAIATPVGFDPALPLTCTAGAAAVPLGCGGVLLGGAGGVTGAVSGRGAAPGLSGSSTGGCIEF